MLLSRQLVNQHRTTSRLELLRLQPSEPIASESVSVFIVAGCTKAGTFMLAVMFMMLYEWTIHGCKFVTRALGTWSKPV